MARASSEPDGGPTHSAVAARAAHRALASRESAYIDEVQRLLDAGLELMRQCGTSSSPRVADIVGAAGLSNEAFYRHFASKEELVAAIVEAGQERLVGYLRHQMDKQPEPIDKLGAWVRGIMQQAAVTDVAEATRAVLWNGGQVGDRSKSQATRDHAAVAALIHEPLEQLGSLDPGRDASVMCQAAMGRMNEFLWRRETPSDHDVSHLLGFCLAGAQASSQA